MRVVKKFGEFLTATFFVLGLVLSAGAAEPEKLTVVATLFPQYDFARQIAGGLATVKMLLPPGTESHTFDPKPGDIQTLNKADLFIYTGESMEPWADRILRSIDSKKLLVVDASKGVPLHYEHEEEGHEADPHIWLDPVRAIAMVDNITDGLCVRDPSNAETYRKNAAGCKVKLETLDRAFQNTVEQSASDTLVFGGRFAYYYFLERYKLKYVTAYETCSTEGEPSVRQIADVIRYVTKNKVRYIFHEELADPKVARSIAEQTGAEPLLFSTAHNVAKDEFESGITYFDIMEKNLQNVRKALSRAGN